MTWGLTLQICKVGMVDTNGSLPPPNFLLFTRLLQSSGIMKVTKFVVYRNGKARPGQRS